MDSNASAKKQASAFFPASGVNIIHHFALFLLLTSFIIGLYAAVNLFQGKQNQFAETSDLFDASVKRGREGICSVAQRRQEAPSTPGRPIFSFSPGLISRNTISSKWDDAEKWLVGLHESPGHPTKPARQSKISNQNEVSLREDTALAEEKASSSPAPGFDGLALSLGTNAALGGASMLLKDKFTDDVESSFEPRKDSAAAVAPKVERIETGTEMTPYGSSTTTRCHTPIKLASPAKHNTPVDTSDPLVPYSTSIDISHLKDYHFAKLEFSAQFDPLVSNWSSREDEEEEVSKSLRHLEIGGATKSFAEPGSFSWKEEERIKSCIRYQREEAKIQAWVNLQNAKTEAKSRKLEVKIQKMKSDLEDKLTKRMATVHRRAEDWRAAAQLQHSQHIQRASEQTQKLKGKQSSHVSRETTCGCFPCNHQL